MSFLVASEAESSLYVPLAFLLGHPVDVHGFVQSSASASSRFVVSSYSSLLCIQRGGEVVPPLNGDGKRGVRQDLSEEIGTEGALELEDEVSFILFIELFGSRCQGFELGNEGAGRGLSLD